MPISESTKAEMEAGRAKLAEHDRMGQLESVAREFAKAYPGSNVTWSSYFSTDPDIVEIIIRKNKIYEGGGEFTIADEKRIFPSQKLLTQLRLVCS